MVRWNSHEDYYHFGWSASWRMEISIDLTNLGDLCRIIANKCHLYAIEIEFIFIYVSSSRRLDIDAKKNRKWVEG